MKKYTVNLFAAITLFFGACSKKGDNPAPGGGGGYTNLGAGGIYYDWANDGVVKFDLKSATVNTFLQSSTSRNSWDISRDGTIVLQSTDNPDDYDSELYTLTNLKDGTIIGKFVRQSGYANATFPTLSPDATLIAVPPTYNDGLMILDLKGNILHNLVSFQGKKPDKTLAWMPDNTILFSIGNNLYRTNKAFSQASLVKSFAFNEWRDLSVSPDGSRVALAASNHIWMMNADGSNLIQVTTSSDVEVQPVFSPDGKYLVLGRDYHVTGPFGHIWYLVIIPADGKLYNVDKGADRNAIQLIQKGSETPEACDGGLIWR